MKRRIMQWLSVVGLVVCLGAGLTLIGGEPVQQTKEGSGSKTEPDKKPEKIDILADVKEWNSDKFAAPPTEFRQGHVKARALDKKAISKTKDGFSIKLPSNAPIPTPSVYQGNIYVSGGFHSKEYYAFKADTGEFVWGLDLDDDGPTSAACEDDVVVFNTESCTIFAVDAKTGKQLWSLWLGDPLTSTPTISGGRVYTSYPCRGGVGAGAGNNLQQQQNLPNEPKGSNKEQKKDKAGKQPPCSHVLACLDLKTGKILWQRWLDSDVMSAPVAVDDEVYVTSFGGTVYKFKAKDGEVLSAMKSRATCAPVVVGNDVYLTRRSDDGKGEAKESYSGLDRKETKEVVKGKDQPAPYLDPKVQERTKLSGEGKQLDAGNGFAGGAPQTANSGAAFNNIGQASVSTMQAFQGSRIVHFNGSNFNCMGDQVACIDPKSGKELWTKKLSGDLKKEGGFLGAPPVVAGGFLFLSTLEGEVWQMDPTKGEVVKKYKVGSQVRFQPAVEDGRIYIGTQDGRVICIDSGDKTLTGWPCWGADAAHTGLARTEKK